MKIMFCTDLHGSKQRYKKIIDIQNQFDLIIIGGDILPKSDHYHQEKFIKIFLPDFFLSIRKDLIIDFGNDDLAVFHEDFKNVINEYNNKYYQHIYYNHFKEVIINDISFIMMNYVPDYPFGLKDWCRIDNNKIDPIQYGPCISTRDGYEDIEDLIKYFNEKPSMEQCLEMLPKPSKEKYIYLFHSPPKTLGLDVCSSGKEVGSYAITNFIDKNQPLICFSGHIHESPTMSNIFWNKIGKTFCIQPGQHYLPHKLTYCSLNINNIEKSLERKTIEWETI